MVAQMIDLDRDCWYTPARILQALGAFDLDPCVDDRRPAPTAARMIGPQEDGLAQSWHGRVWCNPPFSSVVPWVDRMIAHDDGVLLVFARSDAAWFQRAVSAAGGCLLLLGRIEFLRPSGAKSRCPLGCALVPFGDKNTSIVRQSGLSGIWAETRRVPCR